MKQPQMQSNVLNSKKESDATLEMIRQHRHGCIPLIVFVPSFSFRKEVKMSKNHFWQILLLRSAQTILLTASGLAFLAPIFSFVT